MIGVRGQYEFALNLNNQRDVLKERDLEHFTLIEQVGGSLPTFELVFSVVGKDIANQLNEGAVISVLLGDGSGNNRTVELAIHSTKRTRRGVNENKYVVRGTSNHTGYNLNQRTQITDRISSVAAIRDAAKRYFKVEANFESSDQMHWVQHNVSDRRFVNTCLEHCNIPDSFPIHSITSDGRFRLLDARKLVSAGASIRLAAQMGDGSYLIDPHFITENNSTFLNSQGAYGFEQAESRLGEHESFGKVRVTQPVKSLLTTSQELVRGDRTPTRRLPPVTLTDDVHPEFWEAFRRNRSSLLAYSMIELTVSSRGKMLPVNAGDVASFRDIEEQESGESYSGMYFVSKVAMTIGKRGLVTGLRLHRENVNNAQGSLR